MSRLFLILLMALLPHTPAALADDSYYDVPPPGRRVDIGGFKLHINCRGEGRPTVILEAGLGDWSTHWTAVQNLLQSDIRVCSYDRAGYGWSDPGPRPRDSQHIVAELHSLLEKAGIDPPYLLVGHSFGGLTMRLFASTYPHEVSGLVLVEASHPDSLPFRRNEDGKTPSLAAANQMMMIHPVEPEEASFPPEAQPAMHDNLLHTKSLVTSRGELRALNYSVEEVLQARPLGNLPLVVITRGKREWPPGKDGDDRERVWHEEQHELAGLSSRSRMITALHSGHQVELEEPGVVANAVLDMALEERRESIAAMRAQ